MASEAAFGSPHPTRSRARHRRAAPRLRNSRESKENQLLSQARSIDAIEILALASVGIAGLTLSILGGVFFLVMKVVRSKT